MIYHYGISKATCCLSLSSRVWLEASTLRKENLKFQVLFHIASILSKQIYIYLTQLGTEWLLFLSTVCVAECDLNTLGPCTFYRTDMIQSTEHRLLVWWCETCIQALQLSYVSLVTLYTSLPGKFSHRIILMNKWVMWVKSTSGTLEREVFN